MNALPPKLRVGAILRRTLVQISIVGTLHLAPGLRAQTDNFNAGNDSLWSHSDLGILGDPRLRPNYSFPADATNGHAYRIQVPANPYYPTAGPGRAATYRTQVTYGARFSIAVDVNSWNDTIDQDFGLFWYLTSPGIGSSDGYTMTYGPQDHLRVSQISAESPTEIGRVNPFHLDPTKRYRMQVSSHDGITFLGQVFSLNDLANPLASAVTSDSTWSGGFGGLVLYDGTSPSTTGCDATFDNYAASAPAAGALLTTAVDLYPPPGGRAPELYPTITVGILDRDTFVDPNSLQLWLDGAAISPADPNLTVIAELDRPGNPSGRTGPYSGATLTYLLSTLLPAGSHHTNAIAYRDVNSNWQTNTWTWTTAYPFLAVSNSLPVGSLSVRGFDARMAQTNGGNNLDNSLARALQQLAIPPTIPYELTATSIVQVLAWNQNGNPNNVPGLCSSTTEIKNIAVESLAYLELSAGAHRFHVQTDDRAGFYSGRRLEDPSGTVLWESPGNTANTTFDFVVEAAGLYPFRSIWEQAGGGALLNVTSVNLDDLSEVMLNDPSDPPNVVRAWYPLVCESSASVKGPYTADATAAHTPTLADLQCGSTGDVINQTLTGGTFTVPISGTQKFYRLDGPRATKITGITKVGGNVVITYQVL